MSQALLAGLPLAVVVTALVLRVAALRSALLGIGVAVAVTATAFPEHLGELVRGVPAWLPTVVEVLVILGGGIALARVMDRSGAQGVLAGWLGPLTGGPVATALLVVHGVTPFAESVTGFGVGVMVGVPLLAAAGFAPHRAAVLGLLGLCAVPWGALGPGTIVAARLIGATPEEVGVATAWPNVLATVGVGVAAVLMVPGGRSVRAVLAGVASGLVLWAGVLGSSLVVGMAPSGALGGLLAIAVHLVWRRAHGVTVRPTAPVLHALVPYAVLLAGILLATAVVRLLDLGVAGDVLASPAVWLVLTCLVAVRWLRLPAIEQRAVGRELVHLWRRVALPTAAFLALGVVMVLGGLTEPLGEALRSTGPVALALGPVVGAIGGFVTGSGAGANSMFAAAQAAVAQGVGVSPVAFVGLHNAAAGLLTMASPARVLLAVHAVPEVPSLQGGATVARVTRTVLLVDAVVVAAMVAWALLVL